MEIETGRRAPEIRVNAAPVRDAEGQIIAGVVILGRHGGAPDERRLRDAERLQSVGTLAGGVAHEVNNRCTTCWASASFMLRALGPEHPQAADLACSLRRPTGRRASPSAADLLAEAGDPAAGVDLDALSLASSPCSSNCSAPTSWSPSQPGGRAAGDSGTRPRLSRC